MLSVLRAALVVGRQAECIIGVGGFPFENGAPLTRHITGGHYCKTCRCVIFSFSSGEFVVVCLVSVQVRTSWIVGRQLLWFLSVCLSIE